MTWLSISSDDGGLTWGASATIRVSTTFEPCYANNNVADNLRSFGFINDNVGDYYAALSVAKDQIEVWRSNTQGDTWFTAPVWTIFARPGSGSRFFPFLASDGPSRIALHYYETDTQTDMQVTPMFEGARNAANALWDPPTPAAPSFIIDTASGPCTPGTQECRTLGDYVGMAAKNQKRGVPTYLPAWTAFPPDSPNVVGNERVMAVSATVQ